MALSRQYHDERDFRWDDVVLPGDGGTTTPTPLWPIHHGRPDDFGGADYVAALLKVSDAHKAGTPGTPSLPD